MKKQYIIPIFVPHLGCPNDCIFCNQKSISGQKKNITKEETKKIITGLKNNMDDSQDIFSPSDNNDSFMLLEIKKLDDRVSELTDCIDKEKNEIDIYL